MTETELMLTEVLQCRRVDLLAEQTSLTPEQEERLQEMKRRRHEGEPIQYIIGHTDFMNTKIFVDERVLIPRPETEILADLAIKYCQQHFSNRTVHILDIGTGSGNIAIALAKNLASTKVTAIDISQEALTLANYNARLNHVEGRIEFINQDTKTFTTLAKTSGQKFDLIISNPPYIPTEKLDQLPKDVQYEPLIALDGGPDGLTYYRLIVQNAPLMLNANGYLMLELWDGQDAEVGQLLSQQPSFDQIRFEKDYVGTNRVVIVQLKDNHG